MTSCWYLLLAMSSSLMCGEASGFSRATVPFFQKTPVEMRPPNGDWVFAPSQFGFSISQASVLTPSRVTEPSRRGQTEGGGSDFAFSRLAWLTHERNPHPVAFVCRRHRDRVVRRGALPDWTKHAAHSPIAFANPPHPLFKSPRRPRHDDRVGLLRDRGGAEALCGPTVRSESNYPRGACWR